MKPLVVLATDSRDPSGLGEHMLALGRALSDQYEIVIAAIEDARGLAFLRQAAKAGVRVKAYDPDRLAEFKAWLAGVRPALLHVHAGIGWEGHELVRAGKAVGLPVVRTEHLPYLLTSPVQQAAYRAMLLSVDRVITVSASVYDSFAERHDRRRLSIVPNGIFAPFAAADASATRAKLGLLAQDQMLLTVARFAPQKGHSVLLAAIPIVLQQQPDAKFVWVGDGAELDSVAHAVDAAGLAQAVKLLGQRDDVADLLVAADALILPSLFEGLPLVLLEAMSAGLPVVATAIGGTMEALGGDHPFLAPPNEPAALAEAILALLDDPDAASAAGQAGKERFENRFDAHRMADQTADIYASLMATPSTARVRTA